MKRGGPQRLSTSLNARFDVEAPKKALQNAEKQLDKVRLEAQKAFEREKKQLTKKMDTLTPRGHSPAARHESGYMNRKVSTAVDPTPTALPSADSATSLNVFKRTDSQTGGITDFSCLLEGGSGPAVPMTGAAKQNEAIRQLKFVNEAILEMMADAENTHRMSSMSRPQSSVPRSRDETSGSEAETPKRRVSYALREAAGTLEAMGSPVHNSATDGLAQLAQDEMPQHHQKTSRDESGQDSRRVSTGISPKTSAMSSRRQSTSSNVSMANLAQEFQGPPSAAVQLVLLLTSGCAGKTLEPKEMKALTTVLDESRAALKAVKNNMDPDRAQEKLMKRLNELLILVKPRIPEQIISPEEILRCSYLRLSKDNVERLEQMIRAEGRDPGIHSHTDTKNIDLAQLSEMASTSQMRPMTDTADLTKNFQPVSIYQTKAGAPIDKKRNARPDCVPPLSEEEENLARMKKFKA